MLAQRELGGEERKGSTSLLTPQLTWGWEPKPKINSGCVKVAGKAPHGLCLIFSFTHPAEESGLELRDGEGLWGPAPWWDGAGAWCPPRPCQGSHGSFFFFFFQAGACKHQGAGAAPGGERRVEQDVKAVSALWVVLGKSLQCRQAPGSDRGSSARLLAEGSAPRVEI